MPHRKLAVLAIPPFTSGLPLQYFNPHGYQPIHISSEHTHGAHSPVTSLQRDGDVGGNKCLANSKLDIDEPVWSFCIIQKMIGYGPRM